MGGKGRPRAVEPGSAAVVEDDALVVDRVAGLDIGKASLTGCVRTPADGGGRRRRQLLRDYETFTPRLLELADWLRVEQVELVAMEATGDYWRPVFYLLEAEGFTCWLCNPKHIKNLPGRPKTDRQDAVWLAKVAERGMCRPSLVHPQPVRRIQDLTRYRRSLVQDQTREKQRLEKLLEDAQVKLSSVISDIFGVSGRQMLGALISGERDPRTLAALAQGRMRAKTPVLEQALSGHFADHHAFLAQAMLTRIDELGLLIDQVSARIEDQMTEDLRADPAQDPAAEDQMAGDQIGGEQIGGEQMAGEQMGGQPFRRAVQVLDEIPGVGQRAAEDLIAEIGVDMTRFRTAAHLVSWAKFAPIERSSAGRSRAATTGKGNPWLAGTLGEVVAALARTDTFLGARYRRLSRRRGKRRAIVAVGNSVLVVIWHLLANPDSHFVELGSDWHESRINTAKRERDLIRRLQAVTGKKVILQPKAA